MPSRDELTAALEAGKPAEIEFHWFNAEVRDMAFYTLHFVLAQFKLPFLGSSIIQLIRELVINGVKANTKRAWCEVEDIAIEELEKDSELKDRFKKEAVEAGDSMVPVLEKTDRKVALSFSITEDNIEIKVSNEATLNENEKKRIAERLEWARGANSLAEGYELFGDSSEGAGLGIIINVLLLKRAGLGPNGLQLQTDDQSTTFIVTIPQVIPRDPKLVEIENRIIDQLEKLPTFPENVQKVIAMCDDSTSALRQIGAEIEKDPALASGILKIANSPAFRTGNQIHTISMATSILGAKTIREITLVFASRQIIDEHLNVFRGFWDHAQLAAKYARRLAVKLGYRKLADNAYLGGLLHDLGKIILYTIEPSTIKEINGLNLNRNLHNTAALEEISLGVSHAVLGARLASKWAFSEDLVEMIANHHSPFAASQDYLTQAVLIHITDGLIQTEASRGNYVYFDVEALHHVKIKDFAELEKIHEQIKGE